ncbi:PepSY domain-containing protein [Flavobacterium sp. NST-5]|uniref:PepSY domain-containing protein n=1 Tax=Flavobacterium ichthyis TaxID=2698827 RepID=A0ABW9Z5V3_9FLAO|nr:PepSY-associated TM helix domain-containing protein [Flavobacterium ichthyis]NBL64218.1 PepSY domain-containing protein [Flavobacterium ichthyis]
MSFKKNIRFLHKWLGLLSGLIVFIVSITGCIYCFHDEIKDATRSYRKVSIEVHDYVPPSYLQQKTKKLFSGATTEMVIFYGKDRSAIVYGSLNHRSYRFYYNPYSGVFLGEEDVEKDFFTIIENIHMHLLFPPEIGKQVVGISTIIFIVMLISGIILWWPKKKKDFKNRFKIKWSAKWRRVNYDWHNVTGFYISVVAFVIAVTGLSFSYHWVHDGLYYVGNLGQNYPNENVAIRITPAVASVKAPVDLALQTAMNIKPEDEMFFVWEQGNKNPIITGSYPKAWHFDHQTNLSFHPTSGQLLQQNLYENKSAGMKLQEMNYGLHTGQYFGLTGKILAFIASFFVALLPITGFVILYGRKNKKLKKNQK